MKTIAFADAKRPILTFEAGEVDLTRDGVDFVLQAHGSITFQDTPALEELMHSDYACLMTVSEGEQELMHGRYKVTFLAIEPDQLVARISVGE